MRDSSELKRLMATANHPLICIEWAEVPLNSRALVLRLKAVWALITCILVVLARSTTNRAFKFFSSVRGSLSVSCTSRLSSSISPGNLTTSSSTTLLCVCSCTSLDWSSLDSNSSIIRFVITSCTTFLLGSRQIILLVKKMNDE